MVRQVVAQGQCIKENSITDIAVTQVQPLATKKSFNSAKLFNSVREPVAI